MSEANAVHSGELLARFPEWMESVRKQNPKLRTGAKMTIDTKTYETAPLYTIEVWFKPQRRYLPLALPDGTWSWERPEERNAVLSELQQYLANTEVNL